MKRTLTYLLASVIAAFGLLTLFLSSSIFFDLFGIRAKEGNYVLFVVWANFICSLLYLAAAYGLLKTKRWSYQTLGISAIVLIVALIGLFVHINNGGIYEIKTVGAMVFRIGITSVFTILAFLRISKWNKNKV